MLITHAVPLFGIRLIFHDPLTAVTKLLNPVRWYPRIAISPYDVYGGNIMYILRSNRYMYIYAWPFVNNSIFTTLFSYGSAKRQTIMTVLKYSRKFSVFHYSHLPLSCC